MIARYHHRAYPRRLRARGFPRFCARRVNHADQSRERVLFNTLVNFIGFKRVSQRAASDASACATLHLRVLHLPFKISARRSLFNGLVSSPTSSWEQRASSTSGAPLVKANKRSAVRRQYESSSSTCARTRKLLRRARSVRRVLHPPTRFCAATAGAPSVGSPCAVHCPSRSCSTALLARSATVSAHRLAARLQSSLFVISNRSSSVLTNFAFERISRAAQIHAPARRDDCPHRHLVLCQRACFIGGDDIRRAERLDRREMAHDGIPLRHAHARESTAVTTAGKPSGTARPPARRLG